jgi:hypothetical protein
LSDTEHAAIAAPSGPRLRLGGRLGIDPDAIARAEAALAGLSSNFEAWMADEITKLDAARARIDSEGLTSEAAEGLYMRAHDLKGLGATYQYPLVTRLAASMCRLTHDPTRRASMPMALVDAHIHAIRRAVAEKVRTDEDPWGAATAADLEARASAVPGG